MHSFCLSCTPRSIDYAFVVGSQPSSSSNFGAMRRWWCLLFVARSARGAQSWSCDGPVEGAHGANRGELTTGAFQVVSDYEYLEPDETYTAAPGESVTFEVNTLTSYDDFVGFLFVASDGSLYPSSANAESQACGVGNADEAAKTSARVDWVLPASSGAGTLTVYVLADASTWYASAYAYQWGDDDEEAAAAPALAALAAAGAAALCAV